MVEPWHERKHNMKLACSSKMAPGTSFSEKLVNLERLGFEGVEVRLFENEATPGRVAEMEKALAESPIEVCSLIVPSPVYMSPLDSDEALRAKIASAKRALDIGARLGGGVFITPEYCPQLPLPLWDRPRPLSERKRDKELLFGLLSEMADYAEKVNAMAVLEPINRYETRFYHSLAEVMAVCDDVGSERIKMVIDFFHMNIEEQDIAASIERAAGYVYHVQLGDSNRELPGQGHTDFTSGFAALRRIGYDRYMALECRVPREPERELAECVQYLRQCLADSLGL
jgi:sugar phosphate isomerase/epimerase